MNTKKNTSNRLKLTHPIIRTRPEMEALVREIAELTLTRNKQKTEMDEAITKIRESYEASLGQIDKQLAEKTEVGRAWAEANPSEFKGLKSLDLVHGTIGFRTGTPQVKTLSGWTWDRVLEYLKDQTDCYYVRTKEEVDKQKILADRATLKPEELRAMGVRIIQEEGFFIDPKIEDFDNRQTAQAA